MGFEDGDQRTCMASKAFGKSLAFLSDDLRLTGNLFFLGSCHDDLSTQPRFLGSFYD